MPMITVARRPSRAITVFKISMMDFLLQVVHVSMIKTIRRMTKIGLPPDGTRNVMPRREHDRCTCRTAPFC